jgi:hypothetical protein
VHGDGYQPGPEARRRTQGGQVAVGAQDRLLDDVVHVGVTVQGPADDAVEQREVLGDQRLRGSAVAGLGSENQIELFCYGIRLPVAFYLDVPSGPASIHRHHASHEPGRHRSDSAE